MRVQVRVLNRAVRPTSARAEVVLWAELRLTALYSSKYSTKKSNEYHLHLRAVGVGVGVQVRVLHDAVESSSYVTSSQ